jgi:thiol-disulfide isomerase/thioredoxin
MKRAALISALLVTIAASGCKSQQASMDTTNAKLDKPSAREGKQIPQFDLANVAGGSIKNSDLKGKVTVIDFWATWCEPCQVEIPKYNELRQKYAGKDVEIVGVTIESGSLADIKPKVEEFQMAYPVVVGDDKVVEGFGGIIGYPTTFLVSKDGTIYKKFLGSPPGKQEQLEKDIDALLVEH